MLARFEDDMFTVEEPEFWVDAGPAVLHFKLLELKSFLCRTDLTEDIRALAREAARDLQREISLRPCISSVDETARWRALETAVE